VGRAERIDLHTWAKAKAKQMDPLAAQGAPRARHPLKLSSRLSYVDLACGFRKPLLKSEASGRLSEEIWINRRAVPANADAG
jgi:hypothetical protein